MSAQDSVRPIPPWPVTEETLLDSDAEDEPITDTHAVPEDVALGQVEGEPEEIDPGELLELEPEPQVDAVGNAFAPIQESLSFDPSAPPSIPPPLPRRIERTITPVQFQVTVESVPERAPAAASTAGSGEPPHPETALARIASPHPLPTAPPAAGTPAPPEASAIVVAKRPEANRPRVVDIPPDAIFNGEFLRKIRQARELTLEEIAARTRIARKTLENVEADRYADLPAHVYLRGTLMSFATCLGLDPIRVSRGYLELLQAARPSRR